MCKQQVLLLVCAAATAAAADVVCCCYYWCMLLLLLMLCVVINIVNRAGSLDVCRVVIVMGIIRVVLVYVGLAVCTIFV